MFCALRRRLSPVVRDERGASLIEFGLFAPILAVMVMGVTDVAMGYSRKLTLEQAAYRALEKVQVGSVQSDYQFLRAEAATAAGVSQSNVVVDNWLECDRVRQADFNGVCPDGEMISRYVQITISSTYTPTFAYGPVLSGMGATNGVVPISASAALRIQ